MSFLASLSHTICALLFHFHTTAKETYLGDRGNIFRQYIQHTPKTQTGKVGIQKQDFWPSASRKTLDANLTSELR